MQPNVWAMLVAALTSLVVGFIWYNPKVFGAAWMRETGITMDQEKKPNMAKMLGMTFIYAFLASFVISQLVIHQSGAFSATVGVKDVDPSVLKNYMNAYGTTYRTFKHGMLHGFIAGLFFALPVIGTGAIYENRSWRYTLITGGYWAITCMLMGGILCAWEA